MYSFKDYKTCKICGNAVLESSHFYKSHKIPEKRYYETYFPKKDLLTQEVIQFKVLEKYILADFTDKKNFNEYLKQDKVRAANYVMGWLKNRKIIKDLVYLPSQFELKTLDFPTISYLRKNINNEIVEFLCKEIGLAARYHYKNNLIWNDIKNCDVVCDTRESKPLMLGSANIIIKKLNFGDYAILNNENTAIERKSLPDALGTLSSGFERFCREMDRVVKSDGYLVVLIEDSFAHFKGFNYLNYIHSKASPEFIMSRVRELYLKYPNNIQFLCSGSRSESERLIPKILSLKDLQNIDLQYYSDIGLL